MPSDKSPLWKNLKVETEAEGADFAKVAAVKTLADTLEIPLYVKIGGVEALSDINQLIDMGIPGVIAPMVESEFALEKFAEATSGRGFLWRALTIETRTAYENIDAILERARDFGIQGITIGRGDLAASMKLKGDENHMSVMQATKEIAARSKEKGFWTTIGGRMDMASFSAVASHQGLEFDAVETRRVAITRDDSKPEFKKALQGAIYLEANLEEALGQRARSISETLLRRATQLRSRAIE